VSLKELKNETEEDEHEKQAKKRKKECIRIGGGWLEVLKHSHFV
jgi:hypothetical protein